MKLRYRLLWLVAFIAAFMYWRRPRINENEPAENNSGSDTTVVVQMLHSGESREWLEEAARLFKKRHPEIVLQFTALGSIESIEALADHRVEPLVWSPSDSMDLALLKARVTSLSVAKAHAGRSVSPEEESSEPFSTEGGAAPQPMLLSPLVWLGWEQQTDGLQRLQRERYPQREGQLAWPVVYELLTGDKAWSSPPNGVLSHALRPPLIGYADPRRSSSGIQALFLLTTEFFGSPRMPTAAQLVTPRYREVLRQVSTEAVSSGLSTGRLLEDLLRYGPSKFDLVLTYESLALQAIKNFPQDRWGKLKIYYPTYTIWNDHPVVQMATKPWNEEETAAAREWIAFLLSKEMQDKALAFGFRPGNPNTALERGPDKPLDALIARGLRLDLPPAAVVNEQRLPALLDLWLQETSAGETLQVRGPWTGPTLGPGVTPDPMP